MVNDFRRLHFGDSASHLGLGELSYALTQSFMLWGVEITVHGATSLLPVGPAASFSGHTTGHGLPIEGIGCVPCGLE